MHSTPSIPASIILLTALQPPPPTPMTFKWARYCVTSSSANSIISLSPSFFNCSSQPPRHQGTKKTSPSMPNVLSDLKPTDLLSFHLLPSRPDQSFWTFLVSWCLGGSKLFK